MYATKIVNINANEKIFLTKPRPAYDETDKQQPLYPLSLQHEETSDFQIATALYYLLATHRRYLLDTIPQYVDQYMRSNASHHLHKRQLYAGEPISMQPSAEKSDTHQADEAIPTSTLVASYFVLFQYLEQTGIFPVSNIFIEGEENLLFNSILLLPGTLVINLAFCGLCFYSENLQLEKEKSQFLFQTLRQQITPHFMFNVLNHINILMQDNVPLASSLLEKYSDILRYQLYNGQKELISLEQEIEFLQNYIAIENIRWEDKLAVSTEWEVEDGSIGFPPLLLLTFIENAFKHASHTPTEKGQVQIRFKQNAHHILLEVGNTSSPHLQRPGTGLGLANAIKRLDILFHKKYQLSVNQTDTYYQTSLSIEI